MPPPARQQVLAIRRGALGDTLLMAPVLRALRRAFAGCELHLAGVVEHAAVLAAHGVCDRARSSEDLALWQPERARERLRGYAHVVADDAALAACVTGDATFAAFAPQPRDRRPIAAQWAEQLGLALGPPADAWLVAACAGRADGPIVLAPGSGAVAKCWPRARWLELAERLAAAGRAVAVLVGPVEAERDDPRAWPWRAAVTFVAGLDTVALAAALANAAAYVGNDSGPTHLAAMLGVPTVAVFGPGDVQVFAPQGPCVEVVLADRGDLARLAVEPVAAALAAVHGKRARTRCQ